MTRVDPSALKPRADEAQALEPGQIFEAELDYVWTALRRLGVAERDVEDIAHEVFIRVFAQLERYDRSRPIRPWLFGFALRCASDYRRRVSHRRQVLGLSEDPMDEAANPFEQLALAEDLVLAKAALEGLELTRRAVFILHEIDGYSIPDIADSLDIPIGTASSRLRLARGDFRQAVKRLTLQRGVR
ncbi:MAG: sigma-70 family RNA polymerase sigma factor [Polyangiaceae bacterium]